ncbi:MAG: histidine--tRNA ligase [Rudaea sp.]|nr:histidine--tRNA ligase [Rudaea sp.]
MALTQARTMPGVMELLPLEQIAFQQMLDTIRRNYERFGFVPVETPAIEFSDVLLTKQGGETERQVYFVQSTGALAASGKSEGGKPELALRFDLTVPLARYVAEHEHDLSFPFRRYQIQRVYRGERAQRGRFREFYQADIDVIGKDNLSIRYDAEIPAVIYSVFRDLNIGPFTIWLNNRKIMRGCFENLGISDGDKQALALREIDKLDKRGADYVRDTLTGEAFGLSADQARRILDFVQTRSHGHADAIAKIDALGQGSETFNQGIAELREVLQLIRALGVPETHYAINLSIARGLDYYTGTVYETTLNEHPQIGSICSGGRYENLATNYTKSHLPGVGISIGATRLFWQLREAGLLGAAKNTVDVLVTQMDEAQLPAYLGLAGVLRDAGINTEVVMEPGKLARQFKYADRAGIRFVIVLGSDEIAKGVVTVKDMRKQDQFEVPRSELVKALRVELEQAQAMQA